MEAKSDVLVRSEAGESFEALGKVVGVEESGEVLAQLSMAGIIVGADGGVFEGAVHALDLTIGPGMIGLGQTVFDAELLTGPLEGMEALDVFWLHGAR